MTALRLSDFGKWKVPLPPSACACKGCWRGRRRASWGRWGRGVARGGLTASLVLLGGDSAGQRTRRKERKNAYSADQRKFPGTSGKSWPQSPNHPLYHPRPSCVRGWEHSICPHGGQQQQEGSTRLNLIVTEGIQASTEPWDQPLSKSNQIYYLSTNPWDAPPRFRRVCSSSLDVLHQKLCRNKTTTSCEISDLMSCK